MSAMALAITAALLVYYAVLYRRTDGDPAGRRVVVFAAATIVAIGVAQQTALDERAFTLVLLPAVAIAAIGLLISRRRAPR